MEVVMRPLSQRFGRRTLAISAAAATLTLALLGGLQFSSTAKANTSSCADTVTAAPTGPATVSAEAKAPYGNVLVIGSGAYEGCSLYLLTSDQLHRLTGSHYACSDTFNAIGQPCDTFLWPALLTDGAPIAGPGVNAGLLGTVTRNDLPGVGTVQQVTYKGQPLYRFFLDESADEVEGANLFDPVTSPTGTWYLVKPNGRPATGPARLELETAPVPGGSDATVLAATMNQDFSLFPNARFPVYAMGRHEANHAQFGIWNGCFGLCAQVWSPVLTSGQPQSGTGVSQSAVGWVTRPDGTRQVTYKGRPLYLFADDAYIPGLPYGGGAASINGWGVRSMWGMFNAIPIQP
jgi:predicted lipoprotein with Yx(FWY)xxD motif